MNKVVLSLLTYPLYFAPLISLLVNAGTAWAQDYQSTTESPSVCSTGSVNNFTCVRVSGDRSQTSDQEIPMLQFSEEESDAAIAMFGCDCINCINALRQLRGLPPVG